MEKSTNFMENLIEKASSAVCPKCGCDKIGIGRPFSMILVAPVNEKRLPKAPFAKDYGVEASLVCSNCGYVIEKYVDNPNVFTPTRR